MSNVLQPSSKPGVDFEAPAGEEFSLRITPLDYGSIRLKEATYDGVTKRGPQVAFRVRPGRRSLITVYWAERNGELGKLIQGREEPVTLRGIRYTTSPTRRYIVEGIG